VDVRTIRGKPPRLVIDVLNDSPRGTTVREVGLYAHPVRIEVGREGEAPRPGLAEIDYPFTGRPFFMDANETRRFAGMPNIFGEGVHADQPLRVYAIDQRNRRVWGSAAPYMRFAFGDDPPIRPDDDPSVRQCLEPDGRLREPWPIEPRWKLWKPRELRRITSQSRAVARQQAEVGTIRVRGYVREFDPDE
jgi:hypothetical protein